MRLFFTLFEATLVSVASSRGSRRKTKESGTRKGKRHEIVYFLSESLYPASRGPSIFLVKSGRGREDRRTSAHRVERLEQVTFTSTLMPAARSGKQCLLQQTLPRLNLHIFCHTIFCRNVSLCTRCFRYFSPLHFFAHRYVYLENHFRARQNRSTGNPTLHQKTNTSVWSALLALRDYSLPSHAAVLFHTILQFTVYHANLVKRTQTAMAKSSVKRVGCVPQGKP